MKMKQKICEAFCSGFSVREIPMGLAISSPFHWINGDKLQFYVRKNGNLIRFEDSGSTIFDLEVAGVDMSNSSRVAILDELGSEYQISYDQDDVIFHSKWINQDQIGYEAIKFVSFLHRTQDLIFTTKDRVANTFKNDLIKALQDRFRGKANVELGEAPVIDLAYYTVDITVKHKNGKIAAIFPATSEQKALEAVLFAKELELKNIDNVIPFLIMETSESTKINKSTRTKAMNSELKLGAWDGGALDVIDKIERNLSAQ